MRTARAWSVAASLIITLLATAVLVALQPAAPQPPAPTSPAPSPTAQPLVYVAEFDGIIHPVSAEFMRDALDRADAANADLIVFILRTPGGLVDSTRDIISRMIAARTPTAVFVAPSGARAASAGFFLTIAADIAALAPGTSIGAAHPVSGNGQPTDETLSKKAASDLAAYARSLADKRGRNTTLAEQAVLESRAFTDREALNAMPPLVDLIASDLDDLLAKLDGRDLVRFDGRRVTLRTAAARIERLEMTWRQRLLSTIAHPQVAYLLLSLGTLGLTIELWSPGAILPGVVGGVCLLLAFFAFQILPINYAGLLLMLFGVVLLVLEVKVASLGLLAAGGLISLVLGSLMLIDSPLPELQIRLPFILPLVAGLALVLLFLLRLAFTAQRQKAASGPGGMVGESGLALTDLAANQAGQIAAHGEIWRARSAVPVQAGQDVEILAVDGLELRVRPLGRAPEGVS
ncbi:MAG: nodulation protein NfeD [Vicinamibacterales bacterium]